MKKLIIVSLIIMALATLFENMAKSKNSNPHPIGSERTSMYGHSSSDFAKLQRLESGMKNPSAFKVLYTKKLKGDKLFVKYQSTNGFNAIVTETITLN